jgi:hypothetical protein
MSIATIRTRPRNPSSGACFSELGAAVMHLAVSAARRGFLKPSRRSTKTDLHPAVTNGNAGSRRKGSGPDSILFPENVGD